MKSLIWITTILTLVGCSTTPDLPTSTNKLGTTSKSQNYSYCESCPVPTKLVNQIYQPLEPDEPLIEKTPIITPIIVKNNSIRRTSKHKKYRKRHHVKKPQPPKQCLQWSN